MGRDSEAVVEIYNLDRREALRTLRFGREMKVWEATWLQVLPWLLVLLFRKQKKNEINVKGCK